MNKLIILNHKMNMLYDEVYEYIKEINKLETNNNLIILPSNIYLETFVNSCSWGIGSQNVYYEIDGDYTGEVSTNQLKSLGVEYALIGHYERRKYFKEDIKTIRKKLEACLEGNVMPILCFGEKEASNVYEELKEQLDQLLINIKHIEFVTFAYEPDWTLESGKVYSKKELEDIVNYIYNYLECKYKVKPVIIYGGGVDNSNVKDILEIEKLSGVLIGSSSTDISAVTGVISSIN